MTTPIERVRAALERADVMIYGSHHDNEQLKTALACIKEALSELSGMVLVSVEPTDQQKKGMREKYVSLTFNKGDVWREVYYAGIEPYVKGE